RSFATTARRSVRPASEAWIVKPKTNPRQPGTRPPTEPHRSTKRDQRTEPRQRTPRPTASRSPTANHEPARRTVEARTKPPKSVHRTTACRSAIRNRRHRAATRRRPKPNAPPRPTGRRTTSPPRKPRIRASSADRQNWRSEPTTPDGHATTSPPPARLRPLSTPFGRPADSAALGIIRVAYGCTIRFVAMTDTDLIGALRNADAVQFGEFELSHGGTSEYYIDKYR